MSFHWPISTVFSCFLRIVVLIPCYISEPCLCGFEPERQFFTRIYIATFSY
uniref:Uncharacterized protein n=1 Tax=Meloidogyne enterolobii TaxID=390850 RepID=A0A6V7VBL9_MELEN|nr:unnamed protein product [Meloidogyne enterolobii]